MIRAGQILKERRVDKKLSLEDVAKATKIKVAFLDAIEKGNYGALPSSSYAHGFVRNYGQFLGFRESQIMPIFRREFDTSHEFKVLPKGFREDIPIERFRLGRTFYIILLVFLLLISYLLFQYRFAFINPPLNVQSPKENATFTASEIDVVGSTDPNATVLVNGAGASVDGSGNFKKSVDVFSGPTTIVVKSVSRFGKTTEIDRHIKVVQ